MAWGAGASGTWRESKSRSLEPTGDCEERGPRGGGAAREGLMGAEEPAADPAGHRPQRGGGREARTSCGRGRPAHPNARGPGRWGHIPEGATTGGYRK